MKQKLRKVLIETKEKKEKLLIEQKLVESRIMMIVESEYNVKNFKNLSETKKQKIASSLLTEIEYLNEQGLLNEELWDFIGKIFGGSFSGIVQTIAEPLVNSILGAIGLNDGYFKFALVSLLTKNPLRLAKALKDCKELTKLVSESLTESVFMMIQKQQGLEGQGYTFLRNALGDAISKTELAGSLENQISGVVCSAFDKINDKTSKVYEKLKGGGEKDAVVATT